MPYNSEFNTGNWIRGLYVDTTTGTLYIGGQFKVVDGDTLNRVAYWNGQKWAKMDQGTGPHGEIVFAMLNYEDTIYAAGAFDADDGCPATGIMKWDGTHWQKVGQGNCEGTNKVFGSGGEILTLQEIDDKIYAGGIYDTIGCLHAKGLGSWNGSDWQTVNGYDTSGAGGSISSIVKYKNKLYVGGYMGAPDGYTGCCILYFDSTEWKTVGGGFQGGGIQDVWDMVVYKGELYVAGRFHDYGNPANYIARWDGTQWHDVGGGMNAPVFSLLVYHDKLYAIGGFTQAGTVPTSQMACWDGTKWCGISGFTINQSGPADVYNDTIILTCNYLAQGIDTIRNFVKFLGGDYMDTCEATFGISELNQSLNSFPLSPNPVQNLLTINLPSSAATIAVYDVAGRKMELPTSNSANTIQLNTTALPSGMYLLQLVNTKTGMSEVEKFVKE
ncbi:MAG TPA: T9SS type A sorting domain-containing protein [Chitinophagales bacterium]|nr:T9SS type A sorting domain-containing protein [Chitinophagales bacterium]